MIILRLDKNGGINKGDIKAFEHDNKSETYIIQLYKNNKVYDLTNKTVELTIVEKKRKYGDVVTLPVEAAAEGKVKLEIVAALTKQDGTYDFKLTVKDTAGLIETFPNFQVKIDTDITKNIAGEIAEDKNFTIITEGLKALSEYEVYKTNAKKVPDIEKNVANLGSQLETKANKDEVISKKNGVNINDFDEITRQTFLEAQGIDVNYVLGNENVKPINTSFFKVNVNLVELVNKIVNKTIDMVSGTFNIKDISDTNSYVTGYIDISHIPTKKMVVIRGISGKKFLKYDSNKKLLGYGDNNRVYYKEENVKYVVITNTFDSSIESEVYGLGENAEEYFKDKYDKYSDFLDTDSNIFNKDKAIFGYWINDTTLSHTTENRYIYGYIDIENKNEIHLIHNSATYHSFNIAFYDSSYTLIKVVKNKMYYNIKDDNSLTNAKWVILNSTNLFDNNSKEQLTDVIVSFTPIIGQPKQKMFSSNCIDNRMFRLNKWYGKIGDSLGDSLTERGYFQEYIKNKLSLLEFYNHGIGSTTMINTSTSSICNANRINVLSDNLDFLTIMGGRNELGLLHNGSRKIGDIDINNHDDQTFIGAYNLCISRILYRYRLSEGYKDVDYSDIVRVDNKKDFPIIILSGFYDDEKDASIIANASIEVAKLWGLYCVDVFRMSGINKFNADNYFTDEDRTHPIRTGYRDKIAPLICSAIENLEPIE